MKEPNDQIIFVEMTRRTFVKICRKWEKVVRDNERRLLLEYYSDEERAAAQKKKEDAEAILRELYGEEESENVEINH